jgi:hypothetical protein
VLATAYVLGPVQSSTPLHLHCLTCPHTHTIASQQPFLWAVATQGFCCTAVSTVCANLASTLDVLSQQPSMHATYSVVYF